MLINHQALKNKNRGIKETKKRGIIDSLFCFEGI